MSYYEVLECACLAWPSAINEELPLVHLVIRAAGAWLALASAINSLFALVLEVVMAVAALLLAAASAVNSVLKAVFHEVRAVSGCAFVGRAYKALAIPVVEAGFASCAGRARAAAIYV